MPRVASAGIAKRKQCFEHIMELPKLAQDQFAGTINPTGTPPGPSRTMRTEEYIEKWYFDTFSLFRYRILELDLGTFKIESGACDLPPEGSGKNISIDFHGFSNILIDFHIFS